VVHGIEDGRLLAGNPLIQGGNDHA